MLKLAQIKQIILEQKQIFLRRDAMIERHILFQPDFFKIRNLREAVIITGVRRCGKSYLMKLIWQHILSEESVDENNCLYFNFESEKLLDFNARHFDLLLSAYDELFAPHAKGTIYLFFDEIQNISGWEKFVNRLIEDGRYKIFITGSNASLLSKEIGSALTGRSFSLPLYPLSFREVYAFKTHASFKKSYGVDKATQEEAKRIFLEYMNRGGFPEIVKNNFRPLLEEYLRTIIYRDIVLRRHIKYEASLREIVLFVSSHIGMPLSLNKISHMTKIKNVMTVKNYISYLVDSFLFMRAQKHSFSVKQRIYNPNKLYLCDVGLYQEISISPGANEGRALENAVCNEIIRRGFEADYYRARQECDFIVRDKNKIVEAIQVCAHLTPENEHREIGGLLSALKEYQVPRGIIVTQEGEETRRIDGKLISIIPAYKWLLESEL